MEFLGSLLQVYKQSIVIESIRRILYEMFFKEGSIIFIYQFLMYQQK